MKLDYIFLDIDGVMNNYDSIYSEYDNTLIMEKEAIECISKLVKVFNAKIIISSSWKEYHDLDYFKWLFSKYDIEIANNIMDTTPNLTGFPRGNEIYNWLKTNNALKSKFIILDDRTDMSLVSKNLYLLDAYKGLKKDDYGKILKFIETLNKK